jgi:hypothetical protein
LDSIESFNWAGDSAQATILLSLSKPDIVILDLKLPDEGKKKNTKPSFNPRSKVFWFAI